MKCIRCNSDNKGSASHCEKCGAPLRFRRSSDRFRKRKILMVLGVLFFWAAGFTFFFRDLLFVPTSTTPQISAADMDEIARRKLLKRQELIEKFRAAADAQGGQTTAIAQAADKTQEAATEKSVMAADTGKNQAIVSGWLSVVDPWGGLVNRFRAAVVGDGWMALPLRAVLGGNRWIFTSDSGQEADIVAGIWSEQDAIGLWHVASGTMAGPTLNRWSETEAVGWLSIETAKEFQAIRFEGSTHSAMYAVSALSESFDEIGVFTQDGAIVGWSFGGWLPNAYLWQQTEAEALKENSSVAQFYGATFADGREEKFAMGLAMQSGYSDLDRLMVFASAFELPAKLGASDTPYYLAQSEIVKQMRIIVSRLIHDGQAARVIETLSGDVIVEIGDVGLFMDIIPSMAAVGGYRYAIEQIETTGRTLVEKGGLDVPALNQLHLQLYQDWVQTLVSNQSLEQGVQVLNTAVGYYPNDTYLHLLRVELELLNGNWQEAERLLYQRNYPPEFLDRYELLARRISEMKGEQGKIVIRFPAGSNRIPVTAALNEALRQDFLVDTGASMVTIPSSTADSLNLETVSGHMGERMVSTAGGMVVAREVLISALEIGGWIEYDVRALVLDIPGQPGVGLLGLNYLSRFQMDLRNDEGSLLLTPR